MQATTMPSPNSLQSCPPRFATPRNPARATLGPRVAQIAAQLGTPLMPWQQYVADVALEVDDEGYLIYDEVNLTVPRQSGKTTLLLSVMVQRALGFGQPQRITYTAQTRNAARQKWQDEHVKTLDRSRFRGLYDVRLANGSESIQWQNGSMHGIDSTGATSGHGATLDLGVIDEAFAHVTDDVEQAMTPAMVTRRGSQLWVVSTAGNEKSPYLWRKVRDGRKRLAEGTPSPVAYFEWSAPDDAPYDDPEVWRSCMPALGHTVSLQKIDRELRRVGVDLFRRAYLNQWIKTPVLDDGDDAWVIPADAWRALSVTDSSIVGEPVFAFEVALDRSAASIGVCGAREDGCGQLELIDNRPGTAWVVPRLKELHDRWGGRVVADMGGPAGALQADCDRDGLTVESVSSKQHAQACGLLYDDVRDGLVWHIANLTLDTALAGATKRPLGGAWAWDRRNPLIDVSPLTVVTLAYWAFRQVPDTEPVKPTFAF